jgi:hypothetical protein
MEREAALAAKVVHPNVIALYDMGRTPEGLPYLAFPFASDGSLRRLLGAPPPWSELLELFGDLLGALAALHSRGFLHLDVKLDNVLLHRAGARRRNVWLADLGVAVALYGEDRDDRLIGGTIGYMPTEQLAGQHQLWGPPTDLFAFGAGRVPAPVRRASVPRARGARKRTARATGHRPRFPCSTATSCRPGSRRCSCRSSIRRRADGTIAPPTCGARCSRSHPSSRRGRRARATRPRSTTARSPIFRTAANAEPADPWGESESSVGEMLVSTDRDESMELTPLDVPSGTGRRRGQMPRSLVRQPMPKRLSSASSLLVHREVPLVGRNGELDLLWQAGRWVADRRHPRCSTFAAAGHRTTRSCTSTHVGRGVGLRRRDAHHAHAEPRSLERDPGRHPRAFPPHRDPLVHVNQVATLFARDRGVAIEACIDDARAIRDWLVPSQAQQPIDLARVLDLVAEHLGHQSWRGMAWLSIDDVQLAAPDDPIFALVERIHARGAPVLTILMSRGSEPTAPVADLLRATRRPRTTSSCRRFPNAQPRRSCNRTFRSSPSSRAKSAQDAGGNPKYVREVLIHWVRAGILVAEEATDGAHRPSGRSVPTPLCSLRTARHSRSRCSPT